ncbi:siderophore-interacting protein [Arthrobacter sp. SDTb3-6]|uniref:siderophore-interacting protein n=1 Tax=Arthrobacter sp. SDTb3-6 TaxID=2713571 RepID=UPI00159E1A01|nr:siderophore-interacting protein [Arthrobacter sp. SDTb3-6]NVM99536.1 siderophore-interacting protein [Arthrobacter sp. SDTb3-6]
MSAGASLVEAPARPLRTFALTVAAVRQLTPHFRRITFTGGDLALFGTGAGGETLDLRIKVLIPPPGRGLPELHAVRGSLQDGWYPAWLAVDEAVRGVMRTYTVRALRPAVPASPDFPGAPAELDIDFVLHPGASGPAALWAAGAQPGDPLLVIGPCARWGRCLGIEFAPGGAGRVLLVGDETAVPAIAAILESLPPHIIGHAVLEVPTAADFLDIHSAARVEVRWHARNGAAHGTLLDAAVRNVIVPAAKRQGDEPEEVDVDSAVLWETPECRPGHGLYAWIAGEAAAIRGLRRYLVRDVGMDRNSVAFMGYWRMGQALAA